MKETNFLTSACRYCRYYKPEGRRGGFCHMLSAPVQSNWKACSLAASPFNTNWIDLDSILYLENSLALNYSAELSVQEQEKSTAKIDNNQISQT